MYVWKDIWAEANKTEKRKLKKKERRKGGSDNTVR